MFDRIYCKDCVEGMAGLPDECIDLTVTSPPYDNLRTYQGYSFDYKKTIEQLFRVTKKGGVVVWIVNDGTIKGSKTGSSFRQALYFKECGFNIHDTMIWVKDGGGALGSHYTYTPNTEFMFVFSKGKPKTIFLLRDRKNKKAGVYKSNTRRTPNGPFKKLDFYTVPEYSKRNNWWLVEFSEKKETNHPASFPEALARDHILSWSAPGDLVFDPFMGSGTTAKMAMLSGRRYLGFEVSRDYCTMAEERLKKAKKKS